MFEVTIYNIDGSVYWVERFNNVNDAQKWINAEKTRPYWKREFTYLMKDVTPPKPVPTYAELRVKEYPSMYDYLDGIVKGDQQQIQNYINACLAVKAKYPKP